MFYVGYVISPEVNQRSFCRNMKKITKWKSFDFGPETSVDENKSPRKKRRSLDHPFITPTSHKQPSRTTTTTTTRDNFNFQTKVEPKSPADLIVHAKKIQELEGWLKFAIADNAKRQKPDFLLLTGPTGSGKSSTMQVLCKAANIDLTEWTNPIDIDFDILRGPGQITRFLDFFSESKYSSLFSNDNNKKVLLAKDFPNALIRNPEEFSNVLEEVSFKATCPVVFICTDSNSNEINLQRSLFPEDILLKYSITHFSFNACAPTLLKRGLKRAVDILQLYPELFRPLSQNTIEAIIASSMGDIRCAMNQLYLASMIGNPDMPVVKSILGKTGTKRKRNDQQGTIKHMVKDEALGLFHGLGRVLNPKRIDKGSSWRLNCDVQKLVDQFSIQPSKFQSFLFENYLKYFGDLDDVGKSADVLSFSTRLLDNWENHDALIMSLWIGVFGLMVFNEHKASKWNQIKGPRKILNIRPVEEGAMLHPTDRFYYNLITKTEKYHTFNCDF